MADDDDERYVWELSATERAFVIRGLEKLRAYLMNEVGKMGEKKLSRKPGEMEAHVSEGQKRLKEIRELNKVSERLQAIRPAK